MELQLEIFGQPGRPAAPLTAEVERELTVADARMLEVDRGTEAPALKRLTDRHHSVARLLASGMAPGEVAAVVGYSLSHISILQGDPSFRELLKTYRGVQDAEFRTVHERLAGVAADALDLISERLEDEEQRAKITTIQAMEIVRLGADRTGHGPQSSTTSINVHVGLAERMEAARKKARAASEPKLIDATSREAAE